MKRSENPASSATAGRASALEPEYILLGLLLLQPDHGYRLHKRLQSELGRMWRISQSQTYNTLQRLAGKGDLDARQESARGGRSRTVYSVSPTGRHRFEVWLRAPTPASVRAIRITFLTRLYFALQLDRDHARRMIDGQLESLQADLVRMRRQEVAHAVIAHLADRLRVLELEAALTWLEGCRRELGFGPKTSGGTHA